MKAQQRAPLPHVARRKTGMKFSKMRWRYERLFKDWLLRKDYLEDCTIDLFSSLPPPNLISPTILKLVKKFQLHLAKYRQEVMSYKFWENLLLRGGDKTQVTASSEGKTTVLSSVSKPAWLNWATNTCAGLWSSYCTSYDLLIFPGNRKGDESALAHMDIRGTRGRGENTLQTANVA